MVNRTSYWDFLPPEIQQYILQLADRQHHRDQLNRVHQVLRLFWKLCNCGPYHMLRGIDFSKTWNMTCGIREFFRKRNQVVYKHIICCRRKNPIFRRNSDDED